MSATESRVRDPDEALVLCLAEALDAPLRLEHLADVAAAWRLMRPHIDRVRAATLAPTEEPASLFRP